MMTMAKDPKLGDMQMILFESLYVFARLPRCIPSTSSPAPSQKPHRPWWEHKDRDLGRLGMLLYLVTDPKKTQATGTLGNDTSVTIR